MAAQARVRRTRKFFIGGLGELGQMEKVECKKSTWFEHCTLRAGLLVKNGRQYPDCQV